MQISNRLSILIIICCVLAAHAVTLFDGFVGDDNMLIVNNTAYRSWDNFGRLLFDDYIIDVDDIFNGETKFLGSSDVSYRPVKSATHFVDYALWGLNPLGYHLHNLILHCLNAILMFYLLSAIFRNPGFSLLAVALFATHPIQSETVSAINYRHNLLIVFFLLLAMLTYIRSFKSKKLLYLLLTYALYFLAVFSKEAAIMFPLILVAYDVLIRAKSPGEMFKSLITDYIGFWAVIGFFLYIYIFIFPNVIAESNMIFGRNWFTHGIYLIHILLYYLKSFIMPWTVKSLPPLFNVNVEHLWGMKTFLGVSVIVALTWLYLYLFRTNRKVCFMLFWFMASYAIVSNIVPFANPVSFRFMYLPSVGLFAVMAFYLHKLLQWGFSRLKAEQLIAMAKVCIVVLCISWTWPLDAAWKNDMTMTLKMYKDFPNNARANMFAGMTMYHKHYIDEARVLLKKAYELKLDDPRVYHYLGLIYLNQHKKAEPLFKQCISGFPRYGACYAGMGRIAFLTNRYEQAMYYLLASRSIVANYSTYGYLIQIYLMNGHESLAREAYLEAIDKIDDQNQIESLGKLFQEDHDNFPIDLGL